MTLRKAIIKELDRRQWTNYRASKETGLSDSRLRDLRDGKNVTAETLERLCKALGLILIQDPDYESNSRSRLGNPLQRI